MSKDGLELSGAYFFSVPRQLVWRAINDESILQSVIPGCRNLTKENDREFTATIRVKLGPLKAHFGGKIFLTDVETERTYRITGQGQGGIAGLARGSAKVTLEDEQQGGTRLHYQALGRLEGKLAHLGFHFMKSRAHEWLEDFFARLERRILSEQASLETPGKEEKRPDTVPAPAGLPVPVAEPLALHPVLWMPLVIFMMGVILWLFSR